MPPNRWEPYLSDLPRFARRNLDELQARVRIRLPDEYVADLEAHSGMVLERNTVRVGRRRTMLGPLLYLGGKPGQTNYTNSVELALAQLAEWADDFKKIARGRAFWPFAKNWQQAIFCLVARAGSDAPPEVVFVDREIDPDDEIDPVFPLAPSYPQFIASLAK